MKIGVWQINEKAPVKLDTTDINLEKQLEAWIESDPSLLKSDLVIVGRQFSIEAGYIDLLAIDSQGRWVVIEIKKGQVDRQTIAQVLDYASCISAISADELTAKTDSYLKPYGKSIEALLKDRSAVEVIEPGISRDIELMVVGVGKANGLDRMTNYLADQFQMPISVISFNAFQTDNNNMLLVRELSEPDFQPPSIIKITNTVEQICALADSAGVGETFREILSIAKELGLYPRPYKKSIMYTPPSQRNRMLFTVWAEKQKNSIKMYGGPTEFAELYSVSEEEASNFLGIKKSGWLDETQVKEFITGIKNLFKTRNEKQNP